MFVDTHCHLNFADFKTDLDEVIKRAIDNGVEKIICASSNVSDSQKAVEIAKKYKGIVFASVGIHPQKTDPENSFSVQKQIEIIRNLVCKKEVVAIGECGLDYSPAPPPEKDRTKEEQYFLFEEQIKIALEFKKPIIVHVRKAFEDTISILKKYSKENLKGVFHCYSGGKKGIPLVNDLGFYFGIDGNITYDEGLQNIVKMISFEKILFETDSPFLTPIPYRGERNEPSNILLIAKCIAEVKNESFENVLDKVSNNTKLCFKI